MSENEMLEAAAKAAGYQYEIDDDGCFFVKGEPFEWRPLEDDGQALRLAVKLGIRCSADHARTYCDWLDASGATIRSLPVAVVNNDRCAAVRMAIVLAAPMVERTHAEAVL